MTFNIDDQTIRMENVLYIPDLDPNPLSISAFNRNRHSLFFSTGRVKIKQDTTLIASKILREKMYLLYTSQAALLGKDAGDTNSDSDLLIKTVLTLRAAK